MKNNNNNRMQKDWNETQAFATISALTLHPSLSYFLDTVLEAGVLILLVMSPAL